MLIECRPKVKFFITTKADLATEKVNKWLEEHKNEIDVVSFQPFMSYTGLNDKGSYMIGCMVTYFEIPQEEPEIEPCILDEQPTFGMNFTEPGVKPV